MKWWHVWYWIENLCNLGKVKNWAIILNQYRCQSPPIPCWWETVANWNLIRLAPLGCARHNCLPICTKEKKNKEKRRQNWQIQRKTSLAHLGCLEWIPIYTQKEQPNIKDYHSPVWSTYLCWQVNLIFKPVSFKSLPVPNHQINCTGCSKKSN